MKILVTGANGMLAKSVKKRLEKGNELICTDKTELDITKEEEVAQYIQKAKPDYIINCAAYTAVDKAEEVGELVKTINAKRSRKLSKSC